MARPRYFIKLKPGQDVTKGLRILKKKYVRDGFFKELRDSQYYIKPSVAKIEQKKRNIINTRKKRKLKERNR